MAIELALAFVLVLVLIFSCGLGCTAATTATTYTRLSIAGAPLCVYLFVLYSSVAALKRQLMLPRACFRSRLRSTASRSRSKSMSLYVAQTPPTSASAMRTYNWKENGRSWPCVVAYWRDVVRNEDSKEKNEDGADAQVRRFIFGHNQTYTATTLGPLHAAGRIGGEFYSRSERYSGSGTRKTYALTLGYVGAGYAGFQAQLQLQVQAKARAKAEAEAEVLTESEEEDEEVGKKKDCDTATTPTPTGTTTAVKPLKTVEEDIRLILRAAKISAQGFTVAGRTDAQVSAISQVVSFTAAGSAEDESPTWMLSKLRAHSHVLSDDESPPTLFLYDCARVPKSFNARSSAKWRRYVYLLPLLSQETEDIDVERMQAMLQQLTGKDLPYNTFAYGLQCIGPKAICKLLSVACHSFTTSSGTRVVAVELAGDRFLRRMVRLLLATAARASADPASCSDSYLVDLCLANDRSRTAYPLPGGGLALCGVGYDAQELALYQFQPKHMVEKVMQLRTRGAEG